MTFVTTAVKSSHQAIDTAGGNGRIAQADGIVKNAGLRLAKDPDQFAIKGESPREIFISTAKQFPRGGVAVGSIAANALTAIPQVFIGHGGVHDDNASTCKKIKDDGIIGTAAKMVTATVSTVVGGVGAVVGGAAGAVYAGVANVGANVSVRQSIVHGADTGGSMAAAATGQVLGTVVSVPLTAARAVMTGYEYNIAGSAGAAAGVLGVVGGAVAAASRKIGG